MNRRILAPAAVLTACVLLAGCGGGTASSTPEISSGTPVSSGAVSAASSTESAQTPSAVDPQSPLGAVDCTVFQAALTEMDYEALVEYLPLLQEEQVFYWELGPSWPDSGTTREVTLAAFRDALPGAVDAPAAELALNCLTVQDLDGDGTAELLLCFENAGGQYLILHREGDSFYGTDRVYRGLENLQNNGVYLGSNGADDNTWFCLPFENGQFEERPLAAAVGSTYEIDGKIVSQTEFDAWTAEYLTGDAVWYGLDGKPVDFPLSS